MFSKSIAPNILLVDDLNENLIALEALLRGKGVTIYRAQSGAAALELLLTHEFALAILDVQMPQMNGFELAEMMRGPERTRNIPIIFVTAGARNQGFTFRGYESGAVDFLYKPLDPLIVQSKVRVFLDLYQQRKFIEERLEEREELLSVMQKQLELLLETERKLKRAVEVRNEFLSIASHEIKNPIAALKLQMQITERSIKPQTNEVPSAERLKKTIDKSNKQIDRLLSLVDDLLDPTKMDTGQLSFKFKLEPLADIARELVDRLAPQANAAGNSLELKIVTTSSVNWDRLRIEQLLINLISNAIKYAPKSPIEVEIDQKAEFFEIRVRDSGPGIPKAKQHEVFERYDRGDAPEDVQGLGLGLYIVQQIAQGHGGQVRVESEVGQGCEFIVSLPKDPLSVSR